MGIKTQAATEYLMVIGFVLVLLVPGIYLYTKYSAESQDAVINAKVDAIANEIIKATDQVYSYGEGSQTTLTVDLPKNVKLIEFQGKEIIFTVINSKGMESEIAKVANINLQGNITLIPGTKTINIQSFGNSVGVYVQCNEGTRCGTEWECQYHGGGDECVMKCTDNQWDIDSSCAPGFYCEDGSCLEGDGQEQQEPDGDCIGEETTCRTGDDCDVFDYCVYDCVNQHFQFDYDCDGEGEYPYCEDGACVTCINQDTQCGEDPIIMTCNNNQWEESSCAYGCLNGACLDDPCIGGVGLPNGMGGTRCWFAASDINIDCNIVCSNKGMICDTSVDWTNENQNPQNCLIFNNLGLGNNCQDYLEVDDTCRTYSSSYYPALDTNGNKCTILNQNGLFDCTKISDSIQKICPCS